MTIEGTDEVLRYAENIPITPDEAVEAAVEFAALPKRKGAFKRLLRRPGSDDRAGLPRRARLLRGLRQVGRALRPQRAGHPQPPGHAVVEPLARHRRPRSRLPEPHHLRRPGVAASSSLSVDRDRDGDRARSWACSPGYTGGAVDNVIMRVTDGGLELPAARARPRRRRHPRGRASENVILALVDRVRVRPHPARPRHHARDPRGAVHRGVARRGQPDPAHPRPPDPAQRPVAAA